MNIFECSNPSKLSVVYHSIIPLQHHSSHFNTYQPLQFCSGFWLPSPLITIQVTPPPPNQILLLGINILMLFNASQCFFYAFLGFSMLFNTFSMLFSALSMPFITFQCFLHAFQRCSMLFMLFNAFQCFSMLFQCFSMFVIAFQCFSVLFQLFFNCF